MLTKVDLIQREWTHFQEGTELVDLPHLHDFLYERYLHEMPYGTAKSRDGDPHEWLSERADYDNEGLTAIINALVHD